MAKKALMLTVVAFAIFFLLARPVGAADAVQHAGDAVVAGFHQLAQFFRSLVD